MRFLRPAVYVLAAVGLLILGAEIKSCWREGKEAPRVIRVEPTKRISEADIVQISASVQIPDLSPKSLDKARDDFQRPDLVAPKDAIGPDGKVTKPVLLTEGAIPCEEGVKEILVGAILEPGGSVSLAAKPDLRNFLGLPLRWQIGGQVDWLLNPKAGDPKVSGEVWAGIDALRTGKIHYAPRLAIGQKFDRTYAVARVAIWRDF